MKTKHLICDSPLYPIFETERYKVNEQNWGVKNAKKKTKKKQSIN